MNEHKDLAKGRSSPVRENLFKIILMLMSNKYIIKP